MLPSFLGIVAQGGGGGGCPAAGTVLYTDFGVVYPIAEGGAIVTAPVNGVDEDFPSQVCDVQVKADGSCGSYTDWSTVSNVAFAAYGIVFASDNVGYERGAITEVVFDINGFNVGQASPGTFHFDFFHDGTGTYNTNNVNDYYPYGSTEELSNPYDAGGTLVNIFWTGSGGYDFTYA